MGKSCNNSNNRRKHRKQKSNIMDSYQELNLAYSSFMEGNFTVRASDQIPISTAITNEENADEICCDLFDFEISESCDISFFVDSSGRSIVKTVFYSDKLITSEGPQVDDVLIAVNGTMVRDSYHAESMLDSIDDRGALTLRIKRESISLHPSTNETISRNVNSTIRESDSKVATPRVAHSLEYFRCEFLTLAESAHSRGLHRCAHSCATQAIKICSLISSSNIEVAHIHILMSSICDKMGLLGKALGHAKMVAKIAQEFPSESIDLIAAFTKVGQIFRKLKLFRNSIEFYYRALRLAQQSNAESVDSDDANYPHLIRIASIFASLGKVYRLHGRSLPLALDCEEQALQYFCRGKCDNASEDVVLCQISILLINSMQGEFDFESSLKVTTAIRIFEQGGCTPTLRAASIYRCAATFFELQSNWGSAIHLKAAEVRIRETFDRNSVSLASALWKIGMYQLAAGELELSIPFRKRAIVLLSYIYGPDHSKVKRYRARNDKVSELLSPAVGSLKEHNY